MNFFAVIGGELHTPELDGAILPGITRDSLLTLARHLGYVVHERAIEIDELLSQIEDRRCSELFASGTAAIVMPIAALAGPDERHDDSGGAAGEELAAAGICCAHVS